MTAKISATALPAASLIARTLPGADFADSYCCADPHPGRSALYSYLVLSASTPAWMNALMAIRNQIVRPLGLKNLGRIDAADPNKSPDNYRRGDRVGIFSLIELHEEEVILCDDDKHLRVQLSLYKAEGKLWLSTVVHEHRLLGRLYMGVVGPVHRLIVPRLIARGLGRA